MSWAAFVGLFETGSPTRQEKIQKLVATDDTTGGIIDETTECDKAYWEYVGATSVTGTIAAAVVDLYDILRGASLSGTMTIEDLQINSTGIGMGAAPTAGKILNVLGDSVLGGDVIIGGSLTMTNTFTIDQNFVLSTGAYMTAEDFDFRFEEKIYSTQTGTINKGIWKDANGNICIDAAWGLLARGEDGYDCHNVVITSSDVSEDTPIAAFSPTLGPNLFLQKPTGGLIATLSEIDYGTGQGLLLMNMETGRVGLDLVTQVSGSGIAFPVRGRSGWTKGTSTYAGSEWYMKWNYNASTINNVEFWFDGERMSQFSADAAIFGGGSPDFDMDFWIMANIADDTSYFIKAVPNAASLSARSDGSDVAPRITFAAVEALTAGYIGLDNWDNSSSLRVWVTGGTGTDKSVALGSPDGTNAAPIDALVVMETPFMVAVNADHKWLNANHAAKEGLWIGRGDAGSSENAARIWMQDQAGSRSAIKWGTNEELWSTFMMDGVLRATTDTVPNNFGNSVKGSMNIPTYTAATTFAAGRAAIETEIRANATDAPPGAMILITDSGGNEELWVVDAGQNDWHCFTPDNSVAVS